MILATIIFVFLGALGQSGPLSALESTQCIVGRSLRMQGGYEQERKERGSTVACFSQSTYAARVKHPDDTRGRSRQRIFSSSQQDSVLRWRTRPTLNTSGTVLGSVLQADQSMEKHEEEIVPSCHQNIALMTAYIFKLF